MMNFANRLMNNFTLILFIVTILVIEILADRSGNIHEQYNYFELPKVDYGDLISSYAKAPGDIASWLQTYGALQITGLSLPPKF